MDQNPEAAQRVVFGVVLEAHPTMLALEDLGRDLPDVDVGTAVELLGADGLVNRLGDKVGASRAAVRTSQLLI